MELKQVMLPEVEGRPPVSLCQPGGATGFLAVALALSAARPMRFKGKYTRDENEQARHVRELVDVFHDEGVDDVFVYTFARYDLPPRTAAHEDFDIASADRQSARRPPRPTLS